MASRDMLLPADAGPGRKTVDEPADLSFEELVAAIEQLRRPASGRRASAPPPPPLPKGVPDAIVPPPTDPLLLPLCGPDMKIALGQTMAVLHFRAARDGRPVLLPIGLDALQALAHAVADAITETVANEVLGPL